MSGDGEILGTLVRLATQRFGNRAATLRPDDDLFETLGIDSPVVEKVA